MAKFDVDAAFAEADGKAPSKSPIDDAFAQADATQKQPKPLPKKAASDEVTLTDLITGRRPQKSSLDSFIGRLSATPLNLAVAAGLKGVQKLSDYGNANPDTIAGKAVRVAGRTNRALLEGGGDAAGIVYDPLAGLMNLTGLPKLLGASEPVQTASTYASRIADALHLAKPETPIERIGDKGARLLATAGGTVGIGKALGGTAAANLGNFLSQDAGSQLAAAAGAGAGQQTAKELGADEVGQLLGTAGGLFGGLGVAKAISALRAMGEPTNTQVAQDMIQQALSRTGSEIGSNARTALRRNVERALNSGQEVDPVRMQRLAEFRALGIEPTAGWVSRDPVQWASERGMMGVSGPISERFTQAESALQRALQNAAPEATNYQLGAAARNAAQDTSQALRGQANSAYEALRANGMDIPVDGAQFASNAFAEARRQLVGSKIPSDVQGILRDVQTGRAQLDFGHGVELMQRLNSAIGRTNDGGERTALQIVKRSLESALSNASEPAADVASNTPRWYARSLPAPGGNSLPSTELAANKANEFRNARQLAQRYFRYEESPIIQNLLDENFAVEKLPAALAKTSVDDLSRLHAIDREFNSGLAPRLRDAAAAYIEQKSMVPTGDGSARVLVSSLRRALNDIGPEKGVAIFGRDGWNQYQTVLRAASNIKDVPPGAIAPSSGTAQALARYGMQGINALSNVPLLGWLPSLGTAAARAVGREREFARALSPQIGRAVVDGSAPVTRGLLYGLLAAQNGN